MGVLKQIAEYLYLKKKDPKEENSGFIKAMHRINRLSIFIFLLAMIYLLIKMIILKSR